MSKTPEIPRAKTLLVREHCLCLHTQRAARSLARRFDEAFRPFALTNGQFSLMMSLNRPKPPAMGTVASFLAMDRATLTAALKPMQRRGLVEVIANPDDRRSRLLLLTPAGRGILVRALPVWQQTHSAVEAALTDADPDRLRCDLHALSWGVT